MKRIDRAGLAGGDVLDDQGPSKRSQFPLHTADVRAVVGAPSSLHIAVSLTPNSFRFRLNVPGGNSPYCTGVFRRPYTPRLLRTSDNVYRAPLAWGQIAGVDSVNSHVYNTYTYPPQLRMNGMARVQLVIPDEDRDRFVHQARLEGMSLSAWLRAAARDRLDRAQRAEQFDSLADVQAFFNECDLLEGPELEPDWDEHLAVINASRRQGATDT